MTPARAAFQRHGINTEGNDTPYDKQPPKERRVQGEKRMKKATITIAFDGEKLDALEFSLHKEHSSAQAYLESALNAAYEQTVPEPLREYLDSKTVPAAAKPKRPAKTAAPRPQERDQKPVPDAAKEGD